MVKLLYDEYFLFVVFLSIVMNGDDKAGGLPVRGGRAGVRDLPTRGGIGAGH
jgi:hypothetical protein